MIIMWDKNEWNELTDIYIYICVRKNNFGIKGMKSITIFIITSYKATDSFQANHFNGIIINYLTHLANFFN